MARDPLSARARAIVEQRRADGPSGPDDFVFPNQGGAPYVRMDGAPEAAGKGFFPDAVEAAGLKGETSFHGLRTTRGAAPDAGRAHPHRRRAARAVGHQPHREALRALRQRREGQVGCGAGAGRGR